MLALPVSGSECISRGWAVHSTAVLSFSYCAEGNASLCMPFQSAGYYVIAD